MSQWSVVLPIGLASWCRRFDPRHFQGFFMAWWFLTGVQKICFHALLSYQGKHFFFHFRWKSTLGALRFRGDVWLTFCFIRAAAGYVSVRASACMLKKNLHKIPNIKDVSLWLSGFATSKVDYSPRDDSSSQASRRLVELGSQGGGEARDFIDLDLVHVQWGLCEYVIVHTILVGSPVILYISLGGKPKWLPLKFGYHDVMRTSPILTISMSSFLWQTKSSELASLHAHILSVKNSLHCYDAASSWSSEHNV